MKVFLDTNIFMEYVSCRKQYETIRDVFDAIEDGKITAVMSIGVYIPALSLSLVC